MRQFKVILSDIISKINKDINNLKIRKLICSMKRDGEK